MPCIATDKKGSDTGDCLKLRAVNNPRLSHLVDCLVFATVAKPGHQASPAMSSGGDLDGNDVAISVIILFSPDIAFISRRQVLRLLGC